MLEPRQIGRRLLAKAIVLGLALLCSPLLPVERSEAAVLSCSMSTDGMTFSPYDTVTKAAVNSSGSLAVTCTGTGNDVLDIEASGGNTGSCTTREMRNGSAALQYQAFRNSARTSVWCTAAQKLSVSFDFNAQGATQTKNVIFYGSIASGQNPSAAGTYTDALTATLRQGGTIFATTSVPITGSVGSTCSVSANTLGFGTYDPSQTLISSSVVTVNCTNGTSYAVSLAGGQNLSSGSRRMAGPSGSFLTYQLFRDSARTMAWGDGTALGEKVGGTGNGSDQSLSVFGQINADQLVRAGSYSDSVQVTVEY